MISGDFTEKDKLLIRQLISQGMLAIVSMDEWKISLIKRHFSMLKGESEMTRKFFNQVFASLTLVRGDREIFLGIIMGRVELPQLLDRNLWRKIANHNKGVIQKLSAVGIRADQWVLFRKSVSIIPDREKNIDAYCWEALGSCLKHLEDIFKDSQYMGGVRKDVISLKKEKKKIISGNYIWEQGAFMDQCFPVYKKCLKHLRDKKRAVTPPKEVSVAFETIKAMMEVIRNENGARSG